MSAVSERKIIWQDRFINSSFFCDKMISRCVFQTFTPLKYWNSLRLFFVLVWFFSLFPRGNSHLSTWRKQIGSYRNNSAGAAPRTWLRNKTGGVSTPRPPFWHSQHGRCKRMSKPGKEMPGEPLHPCVSQGKPDTAAACPGTAGSWIPVGYKWAAQLLPAQRKWKSRTCHLVSLVPHE